METTRRWAGFGALALVASTLAQFPLYAATGAPGVYDAQALVTHLQSIKAIAFTRILLDQGLFVSAMVFGAGFAHLVHKARADAAWLGSLSFGSIAVWTGVTLVADGLVGGAALEAIGPHPDAAVVRALIMGTVLFYNSSTAFVMTGLFLAAASAAIFASGVLPRWVGWLGIVGTVLCALCVPAMYGGPAGMSLFDAGSFLPALVASFVPIAWFAVAGVLMLRPDPVSHRSL